MGKKRSKISDELKRAIETADKSRYAIFLETGIDQATLSRFMHGKGGLSIEGIDLLGKALGLELRPAESEHAESKRPAREPTKRPTRKRAAKKKDGN